MVDRFKEIENFKPQPYWELQTLYREILYYEEGRFQKKKTDKFSR
jgi:DNA topoisomerase-3